MGPEHTGSGSTPPVSQKVSFFWVSSSSPVDRVLRGWSDHRQTPLSLCWAQGSVSRGRAPQNDCSSCWALSRSSGYIPQMTQQVKPWDCPEACVLSYRNPYHVWSWMLLLQDDRKSAPQKDAHPTGPHLMFYPRGYCARPLFRQFLGHLPTCTPSSSGLWPESHVTTGPFRVKSA